MKSQGKKTLHLFSHEIAQLYNTQEAITATTATNTAMVGWNAVPEAAEVLVVVVFGVRVVALVTPSRKTMPHLLERVEFRAANSAVVLASWMLVCAGCK